MANSYNDGRAMDRMLWGTERMKMDGEKKGKNKKGGDYILCWSLVGRRPFRIS